jgi:hypothetical protein
MTCVPASVASVALPVFAHNRDVALSSLSPCGKERSIGVVVLPFVVTRRLASFFNLKLSTRTEGHMKDQKTTDGSFPSFPAYNFTNLTYPLG